MNQLLSTLRLSALMLAMAATAAHATTPGTITPEDDTIQQDQNGDGFDHGQGDDGYDDGQNQGNDDGYDDGQNQGNDDGYDDGQNQDDDWGNGGNNQGDDQYDRGQGKDDSGRGQDGKNHDGKGYDRPNRPGHGHDRPPHRDRRPRRLVETVNVYQQYLGGARFPLYMLVNNLQRFQGYRLVNVVINGSSDGGMGMAVFCGSSCGQMQNVGYYRTAYPIRTTGERISPRSPQWFLELRGNFWVESIQFEFVR